MKNNSSCRLCNKGLALLPIPIIITSTFILLLFMFFTHSIFSNAQELDTYIPEINTWDDPVFNGDNDDNTNENQDNSILEEEVIEEGVADGTDIVSPESISLNTYNVSFNDNIPVMLTATVYPEDSIYTLTWISNDENVAKVVDGVIYPVSDGVCDIIATCFTPAGYPIITSCQVICEGVSDGANISLLSLDEATLTEDLNEFLNEDFYVTRYEYHVLETLRFIIYFCCVITALLVCVIIIKR